VRAFVVSETNGHLECGVREVEPHPVEPDDVEVRVEFSGINFKDALVATASSRVRRVESLVAGVDAAGTLQSATGDLAAGTRVAVHGGVLGVARDGGFATRLFAPLAYLSRLPTTISTREAMVIGTAGFTAMASVLALEDHGLRPGAEVLVTGATGGVGSQAITYLAQRGYRPVASTGSPAEAAWLHERGAVEVIGREEVSDRPGRVLGSERWGGAVDCVGGATLAEVLRSLRYGAAVAASGLVASADLVTTVYPFITRAVSLLGVDAVEAPPATRARVWTALGDVAPRVDFDALTDRVVGLEGVGEALEDVRAGRTRGRILVTPGA
jgi:putative YhdH/YhfP family quinone oxidoreductase